MPKAAVCVGLNEPLEIHDLELEAPHAGEIRVKMGASGVCHSDLSIQNGRSWERSRWCSGMKAPESSRNSVKA